MKKICQAITNKKAQFLTVVAFLLLSLFVLYTPAPVIKETSFSAIRAQEYIQVISREPHSYYDRPEHEEVRQYLVNTLTEYVGAGNTHEFNYLNSDVLTSLAGDSDIDSSVVYDVENVLGVIQGTNPKGILLVAHYDSRGHVGRSGEQGRSYGAMDDGYGVGTLLELMYLLKDTHPVNSIYFLFTDAEEVGLFGAKMAAKDPAVMDPIKFVINVESRGQYGPTYMFETSNNNAKVLALYEKAKYPVTYSIATAVYSLMPNFTDFTPFIETGIPGMNFATLAGLDYYHSPLDSYERINLSSIQHMGDQVEPVIREFVSHDKYIQDGYFTSNSDDVFFLIAPTVLIKYSQLTAQILAILVVLGTIGYFVYLGIKKKLSFDIVKKDLPRYGLELIKLPVITLVITLILAFLAKVPYKITYTRIAGIDDIALIIALILGAYAIRQFKKMNSDHVLLIGVIINGLFSLITSFILPGASFLFLLPSLLGLMTLALDLLNNKLVKHISYSLTYGLNILLVLPLLWSLYMALTIGGFVAVVLLFMLNAAVMLPVLLKHFALD